jgi:Secretion system C-terminal sorting domain
MRVVITIFLVLALHLFQAQTYNHYFGNLHAHTAFSDGNKDSVSSGIGRPDGSYAYAKLSNNFDFLGISEHNHYSSAKNPGFKLPLYQTGLNMADAANQDGTFLALFGMEYGVSSTYNGHLVIYGFNQLIGWETSVPGVTGNNYNIYNAKTDYDGIFKKVKNNPGSFCYLAHPWYSDYSINGGSSGGLGNMAYNATYDSAIVGLPLRSGLAMSTNTSYNDYSQGNYFEIYQKLLAIGYHLGIGYDHDNHYTNFGRSNGGRLVILAPSLTRPNLISAMQQMHFYGSDDPNAKVDFTMSGNIMGSILTGTSYPTFNVVHNDPDGEMADSIKIWRGSANAAAQLASVVSITKQNNTKSYTDNTIASGVEYYYFAEIKQADGQWIVTSPIWYNTGGPLAIKENATQLSFNCFPNPVSNNLSISANVFDDYVLEMLDLSGRTIYMEHFSGKEFSSDLSKLNPGVYLLQLTSKNGRYTRRLIVE